MYERKVFENGVVLEKDKVLGFVNGYVSLEWYVQNEDHPELNDRSELKFNDDGTLEVTCNESKETYKFTGTPVFTEVTVSFAIWPIEPSEKESLNDVLEGLGVTLVD